jgi:hypothetical protein
MTSYNESNVYWIAFTFIVAALLYMHSHLFTAPDCVNVTGLYTVEVETVYENYTIGCDATEINKYVERHDFERVGKNDAMNPVYVK